jgi:hypothetical protein
MKKFKGLYVPEITTTNQDKLCDAIRATDSCVGISCDTCIFDSTIKFDEWIKNR